MPNTPADLRARREALGLSLVMLADMIGCSYCSLWKWETCYHHRQPHPMFAKAWLGAIEREERKKEQ